MLDMLFNLLKIIGLFFLNIISLLIPQNIIPVEFTSALDSAISTFIGFLGGVKWFVNFDIFLNFDQAIYQNWDIK